MKAKNVAGLEYVLVEGAGHGDLTWYQPPVIDRVTAYFVKHLGDPKAAKAVNGKKDTGGNL